VIQREDGICNESVQRWRGVEVGNTGKGAAEEAVEERHRRDALR
jgi:hypothetical protein